MIFEQHRDQPIKEFPTFDAAVDEFFSMVESQRIDMKSLQQVGLILPIQSHNLP